MFEILQSIMDDKDFDINIISVSEKTRKKLADQLCKCVELERKAHGIVRDILDNW